ncbi:OmpA family protein [Marinomonas sp. 5E14-1]|uniref:OmpA family protein n=1 Tax=Marinomonas sp. 5E14-1 TaxID=3153922 RepID=UPI003265089B
MSFTLAKRTLISSLITASSLSTITLAQQQSGFTITPSIGYYYMDSDRDTKDDEAYSLGLGYQFDNPWTVEFVYLNADSQLSNSNTDIDVDQYRLDALYHLPTNHSLNLTPYLAAGVGTADFSDPNTNNAQFNAGGGLKYVLNDNLALRADFRLLNDVKDDHIDHMTSVGLQMTFGHSAPKATPVAAVEEEPVIDKVIAEPVEEMTPETEITTETLIEPEPATEAVEELTPEELVYPEGEEPSIFEQASVVEALPPVTLKVQFGNNKTTVEQSFYPEIEKLAAYLNENPNTTVVIEGHTDDSGAASYNQTVSEKRAQAIADMLINIFHISEKRVSAIGYGEEKPLFSNDTAQRRQANRRVTAVISSNEA